MEQTIYYTKYAVSLTLLLKDAPAALQILLYVLWRQGVETEHEDHRWHFHVGDIAKSLGKKERTIRKHLKPLLDLGILNLAGRAGEQYYIFDVNKYGEYLALDPNKLTQHTPAQDGHPSQKVEGAPLPQNGRGLLPKNGREKTAEEKIAEQSCPVRQDGTTASLGFEEGSSSFNEPVPSISASSGFGFPAVTQSCASSAASGFSGGEGTKLSGPMVARGVAVAPSMGEGEKSGSVASAATESARHAPHCASMRCNGHSGSRGSAEKRQQSRPVFAASEPLAPLALPWHIPPTVSAKRQDYIVGHLNKNGFDFVKENATFSDFGGYKVCAYDPAEKVILITADDCSFVQKPHIQELCARFMPQGWKMMLWTAEDESLHNVERQKRDEATARDDSSGNA
ncbi:MAG TPA: hypothetical protein P5205_05585 [Candidatus Paceibacterota bacterium]|nr:hypothetical protein [Verrucomicrobiota bacterium]HSA09826.1 hypothetical protein [Candidatus Paceibacterota bacterium]